MSTYFNSPTYYRQALRSVTGNTRSRSLGPVVTSYRSPYQPSVVAKPAYTTASQAARIPSTDAIKRIAGNVYSRMQQAQTPVVTQQAPATQAAPSYSWMNDPAVLAAKANAGKDLQQAAAIRDDQLRKQVLQSGIGEMAKKLFPNDAAFNTAVMNNPFSFMKEIANRYEGTSGLVNQANENENKLGLFFSSDRLGNILPQLGRQRLSDEASATSALQSAIDQINATYTDRAAQIQWMLDQANLNAAGNAATNPDYGPPPDTSAGQDPNAAPATTNGTDLGGGRNYRGRYPGEYYNGMYWDGSQWIPGKPPGAVTPGGYGY